MLLFVVALASRTRPQAGRHGGIARLSASPMLLAYLYLLLAVLTLVVLGLVIESVWRHGGHLPPRRQRLHWALLRLLVIVWLAMFVAAHVRLPDWLHQVLEHGIVGAGGSTGGSSGAGPGGSAGRVTHAAGLAALALVAVVGAALLAAAVLARARQQGGPAWQRRRRVAAELERAIGRSLVRLEAGEGDPRAQVIAAYAAMEEVLAAHGAARDPAEAPLEYLARVLAELHVRPGAARRLTELFEHAKFSQHAVDEPMRRDALDALRAVQADLATPAEAPA